MSDFVPEKVVKLVDRRSVNDCRNTQVETEGLRTKFLAQIYQSIFVN